MSSYQEPNDYTYRPMEAAEGGEGSEDEDQEKDNCFIQILQDRRYRLAILAFWFVMVVLGLVFGLKFTAATNTDISPIAGTPAFAAQEENNRHFPAPVQQIVLLVQSEDGSSLVHNASQTGSGCIDEFHSFSQGFKNSILKDSDVAPCGVAVTGYCTLGDNAVLLGLLEGKLFNDEKSIGLIEVTVSEGCPPFSTNAAINRAVEEHRGHSLSVVATGGPAILGAVQQGVDDTMGLSTKTFPFALILVAWVVKNARMVILILLCMGVCFVSSFLLMYPVALSVDVTTMTPSLMIAITLAMSIDYSLFLLSRFRHELLAGKTVEVAVKIMLRTSGRIVLVSGLTLTVCFLTMLLLPATLVSTMGIGASITVLFAIAANLSITPVLLLTFPAFFSSFAAYGLSTEGTCCDKKNKGESEQDQRVNEQRLHRLNASQSQSISATGTNNPYKPEDDYTTSGWFCLAKATQRYAVFFLLAAVAAGVPFILHVPDLVFSEGEQDLMPAGLPPTDALSTIQRIFGASAVFPTTLLAVPPLGTPVDNKKWLARSCNAIQTAAERCNVSSSVFLGFPIANGKCVNPLVVEAITHPTVVAVSVCADLKVPGVCNVECFVLFNQFGLDSSRCRPLCTALRADLDAGNTTQCEHLIKDYAADIRQVLGAYLSDDLRATTLTVQVEGNPFAKAGQLFIKEFRQEADRLSAADPLLGRMYLLGEGPTEMDTAEAVFAKFPLMIGVTIGVVFVLIGLAFRSVVVPLRAVLCLSLMLGMTYGFAIMVYQDGVLNFIGFAGLQQDRSAALHWLAPMIAFSVMVGLGLDYDVFLMERIAEERRGGLSDTEATMAGLCHTSNIISIAGVVMLAAFVSLLISTTPVLNQIAFLLLIGIIIDCFITTKIIVPSAMALLGTANFWPQKYPVTHSFLPAQAQQLDASAWPVGCRFFCCRR